MINLIVKILMANKYLAFGISFAICVASYYMVFTTPYEKVFSNCVYITVGIISAPFIGWNFARIVEGD